MRRKVVSPIYILVINKKKTTIKSACCELGIVDITLKKSKQWTKQDAWSNYELDKDFTQQGVK